MKHKKCVSSGKRNKTCTSWRGMMRRCYDINNKDYYNYGVRGIMVCDRWHNYDNFVNDMGIRPQDKTLDRINPNKDYCLQNCKWSTRAEQANNQRSNVLFTMNNVSMNGQRWINISNVKKSTFWRRIYAGWPFYKAIGFCLGG